MAHPKTDMLNILEGRKTIVCSDKCKYWKFPHLDTACVLSEVFAVRKGTYCYEFTNKESEE